MRIALAPIAAAALILLTTAQPSVAQQADALGAETAFVYGGRGQITGPLADYVRTVGRLVAKSANLPGADSLPVLVLDSDYWMASNCDVGPRLGICISRELLASLNDEAELAAVLGHEIGHITAGHVESAPVAFLKSSLGLKRRVHSKEDEFEADKRGMQYMVAAGYDPAGDVDQVARLLRRDRYFRDTGQNPDNSTHPPSSERVARARQQAVETGKVGRGIRNHDKYLSLIDGVRIGEDPSKGLTKASRSFLHPVLRLEFSYPDGPYEVYNGDDAVYLFAGNEIAQFSGGASSGASLDDYVRALHRKLNLGQLSVFPTRTTVNGMPVSYLTVKAMYKGGLLMAPRNLLSDVSIVAYQFDPKTVYYFVVVTDPNQGFGVFDKTIRSFQRIDENRAVRFKVNRVLRVHSVLPGETVSSLANQLAYDRYKLPRFLALNNLDSSDVLRPGDKVKLVVLASRAD